MVIKVSSSCGNQGIVERTSSPLGTGSAPPIPVWQSRDSRKRVLHWQGRTAVCYCGNQGIVESSLRPAGPGLTGCCGWQSGDSKKDAWGVNVVGFVILWCGSEGVEGRLPYSCNDSAWRPACGSGRGCRAVSAVPVEPLLRGVRLRAR